MHTYKCLYINVLNAKSGAGYLLPERGLLGLMSK
jgi:hypothetical protein